jgi:hypothetical protein
MGGDLSLRFSVFLNAADDDERVDYASANRTNRLAGPRLEKETMKRIELECSNCRRIERIGGA